MIAPRRLGRKYFLQPLHHPGCQLLAPRRAAHPGKVLDCPIILQEVNVKRGVFTFRSLVLLEVLTPRETPQAASNPRSAAPENVDDNLCRGVFSHDVQGERYVLYQAVIGLRYYAAGCRFASANEPSTVLVNLADECARMDSSMLLNSVLRRVVATAGRCPNPGPFRARGKLGQPLGCR